MTAALAITTITTSTANQDELARLKRDYLPMWADFAYGSAVGRGLPAQVPFADYMKGSVRQFDESGDGKPDHWACNLIEASIMEITPKLFLARAALCVRYLNARGPAVYRSGRLTKVTRDEVEDLADEAERRLVPVVKRRGIPL